jgi:hypothetical protein
VKRIGAGVMYEVSEGARNFVSELGYIQRVLQNQLIP